MDLVRAAVRVITIWAVCMFGCASAAAIYTEQGLEAAEARWHGEFVAKLHACEAKHAAGTDSARACFGPMLAADTAVGIAVEAAVAALREYWAARAAGERPDWREVAIRVGGSIAALPPEAAEVFQRVRGVR